MKLSIVIPTLNEERYLPRLLKSIKDQNLLDYEIIVSDAGSDDATAKIAQEQGARYILSKKIKHPSYQRNEGARVAQGDILLFLDADSMLAPGFINKALEEFTKRNLVGASFYIKFNPNRWYYYLYSAISNFLFCVKQYTKHPAAIGAGILASKEHHEKISGFDKRVILAEDYDYAARLSKLGKFRIIKSVKLLYSSRRIQQEGFFVAGWKWFKMGMYTIRNKKIVKKVVNYEFGKYKK